MEFAQSALMALQRVTDLGDRSLILSIGRDERPELLPKAKRRGRPF